MNLQALTEDSARFPALLCGRVKYLPEEWTYFDDRLIKFQWWAGCFETFYNKGGVIMHSPKYGELYPGTRKRLIVDISWDFLKLRLSWKLKHSY